MTRGASDSELPPRTPWIRDRSAVSVDLFRIAVGSGLVLHFVTRPTEAGPLRLKVAGGAVLSVLVALGVAPRAYAIALYCLSTALYRKLLPGASVDDYVASVAALVLALLPIGRSLCPMSGLGHASRRARVPGVGVLMLMGGVVLLYALGGIASSSAESTATRAALRTLPWIAIAYIVPLGSSVFVGCLAQCGVHVYLASTGASPFTNAFLAATAVFFWGERRTALAGKIEVDLGAALQIVGVLVVATSLVTSVFGLGELNARSSALLSDVGLLPLPTNGSKDARPEELAARTEAPPSKGRTSQ